MNAKSFLRVAVICAIGVALSTDVKADTLKKDQNVAIVAVVAVVAAVVVVTALVINHSTKNRTIAGCVNSEESGMRLTDEKDKHVYAVSGNTTGIKAGDRMTLVGKKTKADSERAFALETKKIAKDFGPCHP